MRHVSWYEANKCVFNADLELSELTVGSQRWWYIRPATESAAQLNLLRGDVMGWFVDGDWHSEATDDCLQQSTMGDFTFWMSLSLSLKTQSKD